MSQGASKIIFNDYGQLTASGDNPLYVFTRDPVVQLEHHYTRERHKTQRDKLQSVQSRNASSIEEQMFGSSLLDWACKVYNIKQAAPASEQLIDPSPPPCVNGQDRSKDFESGNQSTNSEDARLCLFNVIVALEWVPDDAYMRQLEWAFRRASDFLYDATDGFMAFGQVVFAGRKLMLGADIQIMASSRLLPRSWVEGLLKPDKYQPIRMGRGIWHERNRVVLPWNEPEGYRVIIHEWGHYALGLVDLYIEERTLTSGGQKITVVVPKMRVSSTSIMETVDGTSEIVSQMGIRSKSRDEQAWGIIDKLYDEDKDGAVKDVGRTDAQKKRGSQSGPNRLPIPLPCFHRHESLQHSDPIIQAQIPALLPVSNSDGGSEQLSTQPADSLIELIYNDLKGIDLRVLNDVGSTPEPDLTEVLPGHCWVYVLRPDTDGSYTDVIAQGTLDARALEDPFLLFGAQVDDHAVVVCSTRRGTYYYRAVVEEIKDTSGQGAQDTSEQIQWEAGHWTKVDPSGGDKPLIDVVPSFLKQTTSSSEPFSVAVDVCQPHKQGQTPTTLSDPGQKQATLPGSNGDTTNEQDPKVWIFAHGPLTKNPQASRREASNANDKRYRTDDSITTLDGHVLIQWGDDTLSICTFSQGGGPPTHTGTVPRLLRAALTDKSPGSTDKPPITGGSSDGGAMIFCRSVSLEEIKRDQDYYNNLRVVTTGIYDVDLEAPDPSFYPGSIFYSVSTTLPLRADLNSTLVIYLDMIDMQTEYVPFIYYSDDDGWHELPPLLPVGGRLPFVYALLRHTLLVVEQNGINADSWTSRSAGFQVYWKPRPTDTSTSS